MVTLFRKWLIRFGKVVPFFFAFIVAFGYFENLYAILCGNVVIDASGNMLYDCSISECIANIVYIDWFDVLLLYILAVALEFCKYNLRAVHYLAVNLLVRIVLERFYIADGIVVGIACFMALYGLYCVYGGFKMIPQQKGKF